LLDTVSGRFYCGRLWISRRRGWPVGAARVACEIRPRASPGLASRGRPVLGIDSRTENPAMADATQRLKVTDHKDVKVVDFVESKILDEANINEIGQHLLGLAQAADRPKILLDFANVDHLSSAALGMLIKVNNLIKTQSGQLRLVNIRPAIMEVFEITKLNKMFKILPTRTDGLASYN
jgi:anti-sigma B factor antagonist